MDKVEYSVPTDCRLQQKNLTHASNDGESSSMALATDAKTVSVPGTAFGFAPAITDVISHVCRGAVRSGALFILYNLFKNIYSTYA